MAADGLVCGIDLGGTKLLGVVLDPRREGPPLLEERVPTPRGETAVIAALVTLVGRLEQRLAAEGRGPLNAVGLGAPGLVDRTGTFRYGPNLPGVIDCDLGSALTDGTGLATVVDNDASAAAWAEHERGAGRGCDHLLLVTLGTGIGAGIVVDGQPLRGANGFAGEPGHMVVEPDGPLCPCGRRGCWERFASGSGLGRLAREAAHAGRAGRVLEIAGGDAEDVKGEHVTTAAAEGDVEAGEVLRRFGWWVALGVANPVNILDAETVVIGGGLAEAGDLVLEPTRVAYRELVLAAEHRPEVPIVGAHLGEHAGAIGAALLAVRRAGRPS
ncbi:ROK family glucokinase [soil metagenome]